jgi:hypothetical protein
MTDKNTGLGNSLLLKRTADHGPEKPSQGAQTSESSGRPDVIPDGQPKPTRRKPRDLRDRCTIYLDPDVNQQLDLVARIQRRQRSQVVTEILRANLPKYRIDME